MTRNPNTPITPQVRLQASILCHLWGCGDLTGKKSALKFAGPATTGDVAKTV